MNRSQIKYSISDIAKLSGVKAHTIRIWEQRYGIVKPKRSNTKIRYYTDEDVKHLMNVSVLNRNGIKISKIAELCATEIQNKVCNLENVCCTHQMTMDQLIKCMVAFDEMLFEKILNAAIIQHGFKTVMLDIVYPFLEKIGILWMTGSVTPAQEHFIANLIRQKIIVAIDGQVVTQNSSTKKMVMLLPHGYEGGGPEHSSARLERFLQMCAENNMVVTNITTAANFFHALRRQLKWEFRKPLINFSPKANLRHVRSYSAMSEFTTGGFNEVLDDPNIKSAAKVKKVLLCSGKMYFDLSEKQLTDKREDVAIVRLEQIYPLPINQLNTLRDKYKKAEWTWVQEEPRNMGALSFLIMNLGDFKLNYISRLASASTATGFAKKHAIEQAQLVEEAFGYGKE